MDKKIDFKLYDAIIFDLGGVILDIDYHKTVDSFHNLGLLDFNHHYSQANQTGLFDDFETGKISAQFFVNQLIELLPKGTSPNQVVKAWNDMILDFPSENLDFIFYLSKKLPIYLLSNTNELHIQEFNRKLKKISPHPNLIPYFEKVYFSNEIGLRKPNLDVFQFVLDENKLNPKNTLFIDDSIQHIQGAQSLGINTKHLTKEEKIINLFNI